MNRIVNDHLNYINHRFISTFGVESETKYICPFCNASRLRSKRNEVYIEETPQSKRDRYDDGWERDWVRYTFSAVLTCNGCSEKTFCTGVGSLEFYPYCGPEESAPEKIEDCYEVELTPAYFEPSISIFSVPERCPDRISSELHHAFKLAFSDFSASANRVRACLELYILELNPEAAGNLHSKIESIKNIDQSVYELMMAIKWLGNQGSHESSLEEYDLAFAFEALKCCLDKTYESNEKQLAKLASLINTSKGSIVKTQ